MRLFEICKRPKIISPRSGRKDALAGIVNLIKVGASWAFGKLLERSWKRLGLLLEASGFD